MTITEAVNGIWTILKLEGKITIGDGDELLEQKCRGIAEITHGPMVILDLADCPYMDSSGLGALVRSYGRIHRASGQLALTHAPRTVCDLLQITKMDGLIPIFDSIEAATAQFSELGSIHVSAPAKSS